MILVADASPLIFLGKIDCLGLLARLYPGQVLMPARVRDEVLSPPLSPVEARALVKFFNGCSIEKVSRPRSFATGMSAADRAVLTLALRKRADLLVADDRIVRRVAAMEGMPIVGTLGVLIRSAQCDVLTRAEARDLLNALVEEHGFRIGIEVYRLAMEKLGAK